ncbi:MAG TPA: DNA polymerase Y family protein [Nevskiaceae bacterium]|nr:DNA polymerase Y family protein [Nevskiaceae bacterium]
MLWACILLPTLALDSVLRKQPPLARPFALVDGTPQRRILAAVDSLARQRGLHIGQRLVEAETLCSDLLTAPFDAAEQRRNLELVATWAYRYSSDILLDPPAAMELEVGHSMGLFGPWPKFAARLCDGLTGLGFRRRIALAPNPRAARVLAGIGGGVAAPDNDALLRSLERVPITRAGLPLAAAQALPEMGIHTLGNLLNLPRAALTRRFGQELLTALDTLTGKRPATLTRYCPPVRFSESFEFNSEVQRLEGLLFPLRRLLADLGAFVRARDCGVQDFTLHLSHHTAPDTEITIGLLTAERQTAPLFELTRLRLERVHLIQPVLALGLTTDRLLPFAPASEDLLEVRADEALPWPQLVERLRARLGDAAVHGLVSDPDPRPERASRVIADTAERAVALPVRPAWLLPQVRPLRRPPARILAGPERLETGWWDGHDIRRDYYILELPSGALAWAFRTPGQDSTFHLHGWFA